MPEHQPTSRRTRPRTPLATVRGVLVCLALVVFSHTSAVAQAPARDPHAAPMNVLLIIADDLGWADVSPNNPQSFYETPALQRLAATGANLPNAYATSPVCSPSRVSLMTGRYPARTATTEWFDTRPHRSENFLTAENVDHLPPAEVTIAETLHARGYRTMYCGKWHLGHEPDHQPDRRGFEVSIAASGAGSPGPGGYFAPYADALPGLANAPEGEHLPARLTDEAIAFIARDDPRPFFVTLSYYSVHTPLQGRPDLVQKYEARRDQLAHDDAQRFADEEQAWDRVRDREPTRKARRVQDHAVYAAMVEAMDEHIGRLLDALDTAGLAGNTLIIFTSDNGGLSTAEGSPTSNLPLRGGKGWIYEGGLRVPLLIRWPGVTTPGTTCPTRAIGTDVFASIVDAAGLDIAAHAAHTDGHSLRPALTATEALPREPLFWHYPHYANQGGFPAAAVRFDRWKLVQRLEDGRVHLYDLARDPGETSDVAAAHPAIAADLHNRLLTWQANTGARFLRAKPDAPSTPWRPVFAEPTPPQ